MKCMENEKKKKGQGQFQGDHVIESGREFMKT
jgi:hypothetical protein